MPEDRLTYLGIRIHDARKACKLRSEERRVGKEC